MYAVDPIGSRGKSVVQTASFRWHDPLLLGEQLTEDEGTDTGHKMWTLALAVGWCAACTSAVAQTATRKKAESGGRN
jgi:hypothetical protein